MSATLFPSGRAPCGELESICTWGQRGCLKEQERDTFAQAVKGKSGESIDLVLQCADLSSKILLTSLHASYDVEGTNGLVQIFLGDSLTPIWCGRTMGGYLNVNFFYPLEGKKGEKMILQLGSKKGIQGFLSVTGIMEKG